MLRIQKFIYKDRYSCVHIKTLLKYITEIYHIFPGYFSLHAALFHLFFSPILFTVEEEQWGEIGVLASKDLILATKQAKNHFQTTEELSFAQDLLNLSKI